VDPKELPKEVKLREPVMFQQPTKGKNADQVTVPRGTLVKLESFTPTALSVDYQGSKATIHPDATDIAVRISVGRKQAGEFAAQQKAIAEAKAKDLESEIGKEPRRIGNEPPYIVRDFLKRSLRDPDSLQFANTWPAFVTTYKGQKCWAMKFRYRAKNGFGGYNDVSAIVYVHRGQVIGFENQ
jgi:hypothetical protein